MIGMVMEVNIYINAFVSFLPYNLLKIPASIGSNENVIAEDSNQASSDEADHILSQLQKYPVNETAAEANVPLAEEELLRMSSSVFVCSHLTLTKPSHWLPIGPAHP